MWRKQVASEEKGEASLVAHEFDFDLARVKCGRQMICELERKDDVLYQKAE